MERPILFSGPMVRAILEGRKTQTRRCVSTRVPFNYLGGEGDEDDPRAWGWEDPESPGYYCVLSRTPERGDESIGCPYGVSGDRLWVKETHAINGKGATLYRADFAPDFPLPPRWKPSIFMPRGLSRITLAVTGVRVERVQDIDDAEIRAEGALLPPSPGMSSIAAVSSFDGKCYLNPREVWRYGWNSINGKRPGCAWSDNPWVWVIDFKRLP